MTALAGVWRFDGRPDAAASCTRILAAQAIYAPDPAAQWAEGDVAFGRRLFRLLPEDSHDRQPLIGGGGRYVLVADLRLDNRDELSAALGIPPAQARASSDAAFLLASIEKWGQTCFQHLVGDYAFALWDAAERSLLLARDPNGRRPLHYHRGKNFVAFASMPKGLHALAEIPYAVDEERVAEHLMRMPWLDSRSFFEGVERVELGQAVVITANGRRVYQHWQPNTGILRLRRQEDYVEAAREHFDRAVAARLRGSGDVATHLSSGLDSTAVTATAARHLAGSSRKIVAFTSVPRAGFDGPAPPGRMADEAAGAAATAALYPNVEHVLIHSGGRSPLDELDRNFFLFDRPAMNLVNAPWGNAIAEAARERKLSVLLAGSAGGRSLTQSGMELFPALFRQGQWLALWREARAHIRSGNLTPLRAVAISAGPYLPGPLWTLLMRIRHGKPRAFLSDRMMNPEAASAHNIAARAHAGGKDKYRRPRKGGFEGFLRTMRMGDPGNLLKGMLGGWGIDEREPFSDIRLLEFSLRVPQEMYLSKGVTRALAREAFADRLPRDVLDAPLRGYQAADWYETMGSSLDKVRTELDRLEASLPAKAMIDLVRMRQLLDNWPEGGWGDRDVVDIYRTGVLEAISTGHFLRRAAGSNQ